MPEIMNASSSVAIDSTGFKTTVRGDWLSNKWAKKGKGWIKLHVSADTERIMASRISITSDNRHDATQFNRLITGHEERVYADKAYNSRERERIGGKISMNMENAGAWRYISQA